MRRGVLSFPKLSALQDFESVRTDLLHTSLFNCLSNVNLSSSLQCSKIHRSHCLSPGHLELNVVMKSAQRLLGAALVATLPSIAKDRAVAQVVSRRDVTTEASVRSQDSECGIYGRLNGTGRGFPPVIRSPAVSFIPSVLRCLAV